MCLDKSNQISLKLLHIFVFLQPIQLINSAVEMVKPGKLPSGKTEIPFEFPLQVRGNKVLYETYHGVFVNIQVREAFTWQSCPVCSEYANIGFDMGYRLNRS